MYCQINLPEKTALCSDLSSAAHHTWNQGQMPPSAFQVLSRQAPGYLTDSSPASPFQNPRLQPNGFAVLKQALQSLPRPHAFVHTISSPCNVLPHSPLLPLISLSKLPTLRAHSDRYLSEAPLTLSWGTQLFLVPTALYLAI